MRTIPIHGGVLTPVQKYVLPTFAVMKNTIIWIRRMNIYFCHNSVVIIVHSVLCQNRTYFISVAVVVVTIASIEVFMFPNSWHFPCTDFFHGCFSRGVEIFLAMFSTVVRD